MTPKTSKQVNQINSAPSSVTMNLPASPRPPAYRPNDESATPEEGQNVQVANNTISPKISQPHRTPESGLRRPKPKSQTSQHHGQREELSLPGTIEKPPNGRKARKSNGDNYPPETTSAQPHSQQQTLSAPSNIRSSTVIRRVEALITVKREEDGIEESGGPAGSSRLPGTTVVKHRNKES